MKAVLVVISVLLAGCEADAARRDDIEARLVECMTARPADSDAYANCRYIVCGRRGC